MNTDQNDPCPCGSGLNYKNCCADKEHTGVDQDVMSSVMDELKELLQNKCFGSLNEANDFLRQHSQQRNSTPVDHFHGLSPDQMHRFIYYAFDSPHLATLPLRLDNNPQAPILKLFNLLVDGIGEKGLTATATGNLPRNFCRQSAKAYVGEEEYQRWSRYGELRSEPEFSEMNITRLVAGLAGLIRKYKGKFILSKECRKLLAEQGQSGIYPLLFRAFVRKYNWAYGDRMSEIPFLQHSFLFTLFVLSKYGREWHNTTFYEEIFLHAFPSLLGQIEPISDYFPVEKLVRSTYTGRCLDRFAHFFGLVEFESIGNDSSSKELRVRKLPLLDQVVQFHL